jgi:beta-xylosidase
VQRIAASAVKDRGRNRPDMATFVPQIAQNAAPLLALIVLLPMAACAQTPDRATAAAATQQYRNPLPLDVADPFVFRDGGKYYLYGTSARDGLLVWTSSDLANWTEHGYAFRRDDDTWARYDFWAPELFQHRGKYYLHFTARGRSRDRAERRIVLAVADSPLGPFREVKAPWFDGDRPIIDSHVFRDNDGALYLYTVHLDRPPEHPSFDIFVQRLDNELNPIGQATRCISPTEPWEGTMVTEGPFVLRRGETYLLTWSANPYWERNYSVGVATAKSPLGPWTKSPDGPILKASDHVSGTGHHCFVESPDGKELFIVYHVHADPLNGRGGRRLAIDRVEFVKGSPPTLRVQGPTHTPQPLPSGTPQPQP